MKTTEHPIAMTERSVRDILAGKKTVTRRVFNGVHAGFSIVFGDNGEVFTRSRNKMFEEVCPHGKPGELLWVKERFVNDSGKQMSPMFMPKNRARIWLKIEAVTVDTLGRMTDADAQAEGYESLKEYKKEWNRLNSNRGFPWENNQLVWVITFSIFKTTEVLQ